MAKFQINGLTVEFVEQDNADRVALGEVWERITFTPANATGAFKNFVSSQVPNWQVRASALNAGIQGVFGLPKNPKLHVYDSSHPARKAGFEGWINADLLGTEPMVSINGFRIMNAFVRNQATHLREYGSTWEWARLFRISDNLLEARQDSSFGKLRNGELTPLPWGTLKHIHLADLSSGTTLIVYPLVRRVTMADGNAFIDTSAQDKAKWLFATLTSIQDGSVSFEDARHQFYQNALFFRISAEEYGRMVATGQVDATLQASVTADAVTVINGGTPEPRGLKVKVDGDKVAVNQVLPGNYIATIGTRTVMIETRSLIGRRRLEQLAQKHNGNMALKKA